MDKVQFLCFLMRFNAPKVNIFENAASLMALFCPLSLPVGCLLRVHHPFRRPSLGWHHRPHGGLFGLPDPLDTLRAHAALVGLIKLCFIF